MMYSTLLCVNSNSSYYLSEKVVPHLIRDTHTTFLAVCGKLVNGTSTIFL